MRLTSRLMGNDRVEVDPDVLEGFRECMFRQRIAISHDDYLEEPVFNVDWFPHFSEVQQTVSERLAERRRKDRPTDW